MGSFGSLSIGVSGLYASQKALETISHNIANADNPEYVRQRVNYTESVLRQSGQFKVGTGTNVSAIKQIRDEFLDVKLRGQVSEYGYWGERYNIFTQIDSIVNETGQIDADVRGGFAEVIDDFWKGLEEVSKNPESLTIRGVFKERAEYFVTSVRRMYDQLDTLQKTLNTRVGDIVDETNKITTQIADLNKEIVAKEASGVSANDYRDKRNGLVDRLSQIMDISVSEDSRGYVNIAVSGTHIVLEGSTKQLETKSSGGGELVDVYFKGETEPLELHKDLKSGELLAVLEARGSGDGNKVEGDGFTSAIPAMKEKLNKLVSTIAEAINEQQSKGFTLDGEEGPPMFIIEGTGTDIDASNIKLNIKSLNDIAASSKADEPGNGLNAEAIIALRNKTLYEVGEGKLSMEDFYRDLIADFGIAAQESEVRMEAHGRIIVELDNKKQSISAVSLDEEISEMLKFQHAYAASTRFINAIDEMLDNIINRMAV